MGALGLVSEVEGWPLMVWKLALGSSGAGDRVPDCRRGMAWGDGVCLGLVGMCIKGELRPAVCCLEE